MIKATTYHATQIEAEQEGKAYVESWGRAYNPHCVVYYSEHMGLWACYVTRWNSCD